MSQALPVALSWVTTMVPSFSQTVKSPAPRPFPSFETSAYSPGRRSSEKLSETVADDSARVLRCSTSTKSPSVPVKLRSAIDL